MKRLVLSEGKRDVWFVEQFFTVTDPTKNIETFYGERVEYERLKNKESDAIQNFLERRNPYDVLAKSENGKPDLKQVFIKLIRFLSSQQVEITLLIDLDGKSIGSLLDDLDTRVSDNYDGRTFGIRGIERVMQSRKQIGMLAEIHSYKNDQQYGEFEIIAFRSDLESSAEITGFESDQEQKEKLRRFATDERAAGPMYAILG